MELDEKRGGSFFSLSQSNFYKTGIMKETRA